MNTLIYNNISYKIDSLQKQKLSNQEIVRHFGVGRVLSKPAKYLFGKEKYHWRYFFKQEIDNKILTFYLEIDYNDKVIEKKFF